MNIYLYDEETKEYKESKIAEADPEESKIQNKFIPLVPQFATLTEPPETSVNETAVFEDNNWIVKPDYRYTHKKCSEDFLVEDIDKIGEIKAGYLVDNETALLIQQNPNKFKIENGKVISKTESEYKEFLKNLEKENKIADLKQELYELDINAIRSIRAQIAGTSNDDDKEKLSEIEQKAKNIREELSKL